MALKSLPSPLSAQQPVSCFPGLVAVLRASQQKVVDTAGPSFLLEKPAREDAVADVYSVQQHVRYAA